MNYLILPLFVFLSFSASFGFKTRVSISGTQFLINGKVTKGGTPAEGLILNSRMIQAIFDDDNTTTQEHWRYPDTMKWDPDRNVNEFISNLTNYAEKGLLAFTVGLQGGRPIAGQSGFPPPWIVSGFNSDGTLKSAWLKRLSKVIETADNIGMIVILQFFYVEQESRIAPGDAPVLAAVDNIVDWVVQKGYTNVLIETVNECNHSHFSHAIMRENRVAELIDRVHTKSNGTLMAGSSLGGGGIPNDDIIRASSFILIHGNGQSPNSIKKMVETIRDKSSYQDKVKPIVMNECSTSTDDLDAAVQVKLSWGYLDDGKNNYIDGYQSPPVNWGIDTTTKQHFFNDVTHWTH